MSGRKQELIGIARSVAPESTAVFELASSSLSAKEIERRLDAIRGKRSRTGVLQVSLSLLIGISVFAASVVLTGSRWGAFDTPDTLLSKSVISVTVSTVLSLLAIVTFNKLMGKLFNSSGGDEQARLLADAEIGKSALSKMEKGGPNVQEWRMIAMAERGLLRVYDYKIMLMLASAFQLEMLERERMAERVALENKSRTSPGASAIIESKPRPDAAAGQYDEALDAALAEFAIVSADPGAEAAAEPKAAVAAGPTAA